MRNEKEIRDLFPLLDIKVNDRPLIYLDNAATTQKSKEVISEIEKFYSLDSPDKVLSFSMGLRSFSEAGSRTGFTLGTG